MIGASDTASVPIIEHPDVRRMLLTIKANAEAMRVLLYVVAAEADPLLPDPSEDRRRDAANRLALLTPVVKAWCTDVGVEMASIGLQVHGGAGYIEETGAAQLLRDSRIAPIYEGTNGIQAIDLVLRKLPLEGGAVVTALITEMADVVTAMNDSRRARGVPATGCPAIAQSLADSTTWLGERLAAGDIQSASGRGHPLSPSIGHRGGGWLMGRSALAALARPADLDEEFITEKVITARFYGEQILPHADSLVAAVKGGAGILEDARF